MNRPTINQLKIIAAYLGAKESGEWGTHRPIKTREDVINAVRDGELIEELYLQIESRACSVGSILMSNGSLLGYITDTYKRNIRREFTKFLTLNNIL
jgi:hypothetical protein